MGRLQNFAKGTRAVKPVTLRLANAAAQPGLAPPGDPPEFKLGLRVLTGAETIDVYEKAVADAKAKGVPEWKEDHPICALYVMAHRLALAGVDVDETTCLPADPIHPKPCFLNAQEILESPLLGTENIVWLNQQWIDWQDENSPLMKRYTFEECIGMVLQDMKRSEGDDGPLVSLPRATLVSFIRILGNMLLTLRTLKSGFGTPDTSDASTMSTSDASGTSAKEAEQH